MKQQFLVGISDTIRVTFYEDNRALVPTSATITLYKPDGATLQAETSAVVSSSTGEVTYSLSATHTATKDLNYRAKWSYVVGGETFYEEQLFDVVRSLLSIPITDEDLFIELESLRETNIQKTGTATSATSSTLIDTSELSDPDDYWTGGTIEILSGTGAEQIRDISDFAQSTSTVSVSPNWTTTPDSTSVYRIVKGYTKKIAQAFEKIAGMLYNKGQRHHLIIESSQIKIPMIYLTVHFICLDLMKDVDDKWDRLGQRYWELFKDEFGDLKLDYDEDESGTITGDEEHSDRTAFRILRA